MSKADSKDELENEFFYTALFIRQRMEMPQKFAPKYISQYTVFRWPHFLWLSGLFVVLGPVNAEPTGGQVVNGQAQITQTVTPGSNTTTIKQNTPQVSINWQSFNVGDKDRVVFQQPGASSLAINRILGSQASNILGKIDANGQVWLINPNGIMFGKNAQVNVGGLVASTLDTANPLAAAGLQRFSGSSTASVTNAGLINAVDGGYVALLGHRVSNQGTVQATGGKVAMGAGNTVDVQFSNNQLIGLQVYESLLDAMSENSGTISADSGEVFLKAGAPGTLLNSAVNNTGVIQARTVKKVAGKIVLMSGMKAGLTANKGSLDASSSDDGNGGFIETSGNNVQIGDSSNITTRSASGKNGNVGTLAGAGDSVKTAGSQVFLDKNAGNNKTVRASGVAIKDSDNADVSSNYNFHYEDNTNSRIDSLLLETVISHPVQQFNQTVAPSFKPVDMFVFNQMANANASSPTLLLPAGLQKDLVWPSNQTPSNQTPGNQLQNNPSQSNPAQNNPSADTPSSKKDNDDEK